MNSEDELYKMAVELYDIGAIKYGDFPTNVGLRSPINIDLRVIVSYPKLLARIANKLWTLLSPQSRHHHICGVPYTAIPIATIISTEFDTSMIICLKETKSYIRKKMLEGAYKVEENVVIIESVVTSGASIREVAMDLEREGLKANDALAVVDREQGGEQNLKKSGIKVKCLFKLSELVDYLQDAGRLSDESARAITEYIFNVRAPRLFNKKDRLTQDFSIRAKFAKNPIAAKLLTLMAEKRTTICLAANFTKSRQILDFAELAGPHIAALKIHADIVDDFSDNFVQNLKSLSKTHNFLIMEDRKFADIGYVASQQFSRGIHRIVQWADLVTVHVIAGPGVLDGIKTGLDGIREPKGVFLIAEMSSIGALTDTDYAASTIKMAKDNELVAGFVCQNNLFGHPGQIQLTPGVRLVKSSDNFGQQYNTPAQVVKSGADLVVVGRGVTKANNPLEALLVYKQTLYKGYENRIKPPQST